MSFSIARPGIVQLRIFDLNGRLVRELLNGARAAGAGSVNWDGTNAAGARAAAGIYFVQLTGPGLSEAQRVVLLQ